LKTCGNSSANRSLADIDAKWVTDYRNHRKRNPQGRIPTRKVKGATVNREMAYLRLHLNFAIERKYISENPASRVKPFDERRERPRSACSVWKMSNAFWKTPRRT